MVVMIALFITAATSMSAASLSGNIVDQNGQPLANAAVFLIPTSASTYSNTDGNYVISYLQPQSYQVMVSAPGFETIKQTITVDGDVVVNFRMTPVSYVIRGSVRSDDGTIITGATLYFQELSMSTFTNSDGNYEGRLYAGEYTVTISKSGFQTLETTVTLNSDARYDFVLRRDL
jgi:uncharacterized membrane protein